MSEQPEVEVLADIFEYWFSKCSSWRPMVGEQLMCLLCRESLFGEVSGLRGLAPHSILHELCTQLEGATSLVARELWLACERCTAGERESAACTHDLQAHVLVLDQVGRCSVELTTEVEMLSRARSSWEREYCVRRLDEWLGQSLGWRPSERMISIPGCTRCADHPLRGEATVRRLPHDLRHSLFELLDDVEDEFAEPVAVRGRERVVERGSESGSWTRGMLLSLVVEGALGISALIETVVDEPRARWIVEHRSLTVVDVAREDAIARARPVWEGRLATRFDDLVAQSGELASWRRGEQTEHVYRSPYTLAACPDMHWPSWLLTEILAVATDLRSDQYMATRDSSSDSPGRAMADFDAWLFERIKVLPLLEHRVAREVQARHGENLRRSLGLRMLSEFESTIFDSPRPC